MLKITIEGLPDEVEETLDKMMEIFIINRISSPYWKGNSNYIWVNVELELPTVM